MTAADLTEPRQTPQRLPQPQAVSQTSLAARCAAPTPRADLQAPQRAAGVFCFSIQAAADPGVLPRILELFAKRGQVPRRWVSDRVGPGGRELAVDLQVEGLSAPRADYIARCLRQLPCVSLVLTSEKLSGEKLSGEALSP